MAAAAGIVLAAGRGERFGSQKLIELVDGEPMLNRTIRSLLDAGLNRIIVVTSPGGGLDRVPLLGDPRVRQAVNSDPARGMFSSIQTGVAAASDCDPLVLLPGDMPFVRASTVAAILGHPPGAMTVSIARFGAERGHPLALPRSLGSEILKADAQSNLSTLLTTLGVERVYVDVDDPGILRDVDVRSDLES